MHLRGLLLGALGASLFLTGVPTAQARTRLRVQRELGLIDCFALDQALLPDDVEPRGWLDAERFLTFEPVTDSDDPAEREASWSTWFTRSVVDPAEREVFVERKWLDFLEGWAGYPDGVFETALAEPDAWHWLPKHDGFVFSVADDLHYLAFGGEGTRRLTFGPGAEIGVQLAPDGVHCAYVRGHDLYVAPVTYEGQERPLTEGGHEDLLHGRLDWIYQEELYGRGNFQGFWWSPDSTRIALLRIDESPVRDFELVSDIPVQAEVEVTNYPKAGAPNPVVTLGVVDIAGGPVRWFAMDRYGTMDTLLVRVTWAPDGKEVFFQVQEREQRWLDLLAGDAATGAIRHVFREESDCFVEAGPEPVWLKDGAEFLWQSARDGFEHLYRYRRDGELIGRLTEGRFEADQVVHVDETAGEVFFVGDAGRFTEQHLSKVGLAGGDVEVLTAHRKGWNDVEFAPDGQHFVLSHSRIDHPMSRLVCDRDGKEVGRIVDSRDGLLTTFGVGRPEFVTVDNRDGFGMECMLFRPADFDPGKRYPALCFTYSGPHTPRVLDRWRWRDTLWHHRLAQQGYVVWVCDNRSASGKGREATCTAWRDLGRGELRDLEDGLDWLLAQGFVDPERVALWGWSYGGYQTLYALTHSKKWAAGIAVNPVTDWSLYDSIYTERYMGTPASNPEGYRFSSVLRAAKDLHGELLLVHSTMDDNVHMQNSMTLCWELQQAGIPFRFMPYPRVRHGMQDFRQQLHLFATMESFLGDALRGGPGR